MHKDIISCFLLDESETLPLIEPLYRPLTPHRVPPFLPVAMYGGPAGLKKTAGHDSPAASFNSPSIFTKDSIIIQQHKLLKNIISILLSGCQ